MATEASGRIAESRRTLAAAAPPRLARAGAIAWNIIGIVLVVGLVGWAAGRLMPVLLPFSIALLLTALLRPMAARLEGKGWPPALAATVTVLLLLAAMVGIGLVVIPPFVARLADLGENIQEGGRQVAYSVGQDLAGISRAEVDRFVDGAETSLRDHAGGLAGNALTGATTFAGLLASAVLVVFLCFFLLKDGRRLWSWLLGLVPRERRETVDAAASKSWRALGTYMAGVVFVATVDAVCIGAALLLLGVPLALPLIVLTWFAAFFPIIGSVVVGVAAVLVALVAQGVGTAVVITIVILAVQQLEGNVLYPVVVGPRLRLHPITVLLAVAIGGTIAGLAGAFLAVPAATVGSSVLHHVRERRAAAPPVELALPVSGDREHRPSVITGP